MLKFKHIYSIAALLLLVAGFALSFWPLGLIGLLLAAGSGQYTTAIGIGLLIDVAYGAPIGWLHALYVPFTVLSFVSCALYYSVSAYFREGDTGRL